MLGVEMNTLERNAVVEKSIRRLKAMGLNVNVIAEGNNEVFVFVTLESILGIIKNAVTFPNKSVTVEEGCIVVHIWRRG